MALQLVLERRRALRQLDLHLGDAPDFVLGVEAGGPPLAAPLLDLLHEAARVDCTAFGLGRTTFSLGRSGGTDVGLRGHARISHAASAPARTVTAHPRRPAGAATGG